MKKTRLTLAAALAGSMLALSACEPGSVAVGGGVSVGTGYYDSMLWNDYYYHGRPGYHPPAHRPDRPARPDRPNRPPAARPLPARPPIHRPR